MKRLTQLSLFALTLALLGCAEPGRYPVSGQECAPTDPVLDMDTADCSAIPQS